MLNARALIAPEALPGRTSAATARASRVLLHPGCPYSSTPAGGLPPSRANASGFCCGHSTASCALGAKLVSGVRCSPWNTVKASAQRAELRWIGRRLRMLYQLNVTPDVLKRKLTDICCCSEAQPRLKQRSP